MIRRHHPIRRTRPRHGFTLLELLLAITILASISALVAALWTQTSAWAGENGSTLKTMRLPRVLELLQAQWADRRGAFRLDEAGSSVIAEPDRLSFITATPILFPDWPVVRAQYIVERDYDTPPGAPPAWRLAYIETRLSDLSKPPEEAEDLIAQGRGEDAGNYILLSNLASLSFDRFGVGNRSILKNGSRVEAEEENPDPLEKQPSVLQNRTPDEAEDKQKWRPFADPFDGLIPAVRLVGEYEGEAFSCVFVIEGSR